MKCFVVVLVVFCVVGAAQSYRCNNYQQCHGDDQCCNTRSFFSKCCPGQSTCCVNGPKVKCCGPLDVCCNETEYRGVSCCPKNYRCCGAGRYRGLRNTCCYRVPVWLWIIMGISMSLILLMLLLTLVECIIEERNDSNDYNAAYNTYQHYPTDYGTYRYNNNDLYNEPRYPTPPPTYPSRTPPPAYEDGSAEGNNNNNRANNNNNRANNNNIRANSNNVNNRMNNDTTNNNTEDNVTPDTDESDVNTTLESDVNTTLESDANTTLGTQTVEPQTEVLRRSESGSYSTTEPHKTVNSWESFLRRTLDRKRKRPENLQEEPVAMCSASEITLDSGIMELDYVSDYSDDSSFHCSSWEGDEEEIRQGKEVVYELNPNKSTSRVPRLQSLVSETVQHRPAIQTDNTHTDNWNVQTDSDIESD